MKDNGTKGKIVLHARLKALSPLHIGSGSDDRSDMDILLDDDGRPFVPATSFTGVLRHALSLDPSAVASHEEDIAQFWGYTKGMEGHQSAFVCSDLVCITPNPRVAIRHGIRIDNKTGMAEDKGKFDYEVVERGADFNLEMEFSLKEKTEAFSRKMIATIWALLQEKRVRMGAKTNSGLGEVSLVEAESHIYALDFSKKKDLYHWLTRQLPQQNIVAAAALGDPFPIPTRSFSVDITLRIKNSFIIRSYSEDPDMPDATHIKSGDDWALTGTSLKGAIRARAERIINTLNKDQSVVRSVFGHVDGDQESKSAAKGRIRVKEIILPRYIAELQNRIKIDRFTAGTIESALFDSMPLFPSLQDKALQVQFRIRDYKPHEAGLLLLVLKDLWTGDLAVGGEKNVGRGVFQGLRATIAYGDEQIVLREDLKELSPEHRDKLEAFVKALISEN